MITFFHFLIEHTDQPPTNLKKQKELLNLVTLRTPRSDSNLFKHLVFHGFAAYDSCIMTSHTFFFYFLHTKDVVFELLLSEIGWGHLAIPRHKLFTQSVADIFVTFVLLRRLAAPRLQVMYQKAQSNFGNIVPSMITSCPGSEVEN